MRCHDGVCLNKLGRLAAPPQARPETNGSQPHRLGPLVHHQRFITKWVEEEHMAYSHILVGASTSPVRPVVRRISPSDLYQSLARGIDDFAAMPSHAVFLCVVYPLLGIFLIAMTLGNSMLPLAFPIAAGFALVGPLAAIGLYELSRRREAGLDSSSSHVLDVLHSPSLGAIVAMGVLLMAIFLIWLAVAEAIYVANFGYGAPGSLRQFADAVFNTSAGWN